MKIFISWSGENSHKVALFLSEWIPTVIDTVSTWISSKDISKGTRWSPEIATNLEEAQFGIICVVPDNFNEPWLNFEAGAISKSFENSRVVPFILGMNPDELKGPLSQFQCVVYNEEDIMKLICSINEANQESKVDKDKLSRSFKMCWDSLNKELDKIISELTSSEENPDAGVGQAVTDVAVPTVEDINEDLDLSDDQITILSLFAINNNNDGLQSKDVAASTQLNLHRTEYYLHELVENDYLYNTLNMYSGTRYHLDDKGRKYCMDNGII